MKNFKQIVFGLLVGAMAIGFSAFTLNTKTISRAEMNKRVNTQTWHFTGATLNDDKSESNYSTGAGTSCDGIVEVPCTISFDADLYTMPATKTPLQNYLDSKTAVQIRTDADTKRSE